MNYTENYKGIKIDIQAVDTDLPDSVEQEIRDSIDKLIRFGLEINAVDIYFKSEGHSHLEEYSIGMRVGILGKDIFSDEKGDNWLQMLRNVTDKSIRQHQKNK
jgi:putative sigma-54 modulation protein